MTLTGTIESLGGGLTKKAYSYDALGSLVDIIFNALGQVVQATVVKSTSGTTATASASTATGGTSVAASATAAARRAY